MVYCQREEPSAAVGETLSCEPEDVRIHFGLQLLLVVTSFPLSSDTSLTAKREDLLRYRIFCESEDLRIHFGQLLLVVTSFPFTIATSSSVL